ncbi:MAG: hypothetical protein ACREUT_17590 [Steroidobacteraceae bacterium]
MSDGVLAAIIAAGATVFGSFVQLRTSFAKEIAARTRSTSTRKTNHVLVVLLVVMLLGAGVAGFALAQWVFEGERATQQALVRDLRDRIDDFTRYRNDIEQTRTELHSAVETDVLRRMGADGVVALGTAAPCKPSITRGRAATSVAVGRPALTAAVAKPSVSVPQSPSPAPLVACSESDAAPIVLCATIPAAAQVGNVELYVRQSDNAGHWTDTRVLPGEAAESSRFAAKPVEFADGSALKQECIGFAQWSDQARVARMVVHYSL